MKSIILLSIGAVLLLVLSAVPVVGAEVVFEVTDPERDDKGPGTYVYPKADVFAPGIFDLLRFKVSKIAESATFEFEFKALGPPDTPNPWGSKTGFSFQFIHVYVDTAPGGRTDTFGPNVEISPADAWEIALTIGPFWDSEPEANMIYLKEIKHALKMKISADPATITIKAEAPIELVGEPTKDWRYVVMVGSWDMGRFRSIGVAAEEWTGGGADSDAVIAGVAPLIYDIIVPEGENQYAILKGYDAKAGTLAQVLAVPAAPPVFPAVMVAIVAIVIIIAIIGGILLWRKKK